MLYIKGIQNPGDKIVLGMFGGKQVDLLDWSGNSNWEVVRENPGIIA